MSAFGDAVVYLNDPFNWTRTGGILDLLVEFVGPAGRVVGLDSDPILIELATRFAAERDILAAAPEKLARLETMTDGAAQSLAREIAAALQELGHGI